MMGIRADGNRFSTDVVMTLAKSPAGDFYVLAIRDTTSQRTLQEELIQASKLSTLGEMAAGMAHELNQPLNVIRMSADNAAMRLERGAAQENYLQETLNGIGDQAAKLGKMILDLRIFSRREEHSDKLNFIPTEVAGAACRLMRGQLNIDSIDIIESYSESCRAVQGSGNQLEQVIINLLSNARDAISVSIRKVVESYESDVIQRSCRQFEDKIDVDSRKSRFL
jgi:C4-dicarboxylate-specific signal transduction histidine kinase